MLNYFQLNQHEPIIFRLHSTHSSKYFYKGRQSTTNEKKLPAERGAEKKDRATTIICYSKKNTPNTKLHAKQEIEMNEREKKIIYS